MQVHRNQKPRNQKLMNEYAIKARTSDIRRRTWAGSGGRCMRRPCGARVVASRGLELEVTIRGSGTPAASALARHCEATGVSLPREGARTRKRTGSPVSHGIVALCHYGIVRLQFHNAIMPYWHNCTIPQSHNHCFRCLESRSLGVVETF